MHKYWIVVLAIAPLPAAELSLAEAARLALQDNPAIGAAREQESAAAARVRQAESGRLPRVQWQESVQGGNNPVYVFSSLLSQRQFGPTNFGLPGLVRPDPLQNFQSILSAEQSVVDFGRTRARRREAETGRGMATEERRRRELEILTQTARAYFGTLLAEASFRAAEKAVQSVEATRDQAVARRNAQVATEADVLAVDVQLAAAREEVIGRSQRAEVARATLNHALGQPLEAVHLLTTPLHQPSPVAEDSPAGQRPEVRMAALQQDLAQARQAQASALLRPEVGVRFQLEADRQNFLTKGGVNWIAMGTLRWNLFDGGLARQMRAEAGYAASAAALETRATTSAVALQVRQADAAIRAAAAREIVTAATIHQAQETTRILRNRYGGGLATVSEVLRAEAALLEAETRRLAALHDQRIARIEREAASGALTGDSHVLR